MSGYKNFCLSVLTAAGISLTMGLPQTSATPEYPVAHIASPDVYSEILTNRKVRVLNMTLQPGESDEWHHHPAETVCFIKGGTLKIRLPDGGAVTKEVAVGEVMYHEAWVHRVENIGNTVVQAVIVEDMDELLGFPMETN